jgi:predicted transcriptional regulator
MSDSKFDFALGPLESEVMEATWKLGGWVTIADVLEERERSGGSKLAYSTIKAVVSNLHDKGHLRKRSEGKQNGNRHRDDVDPDLPGSGRAAVLAARVLDQQFDARRFAARDRPARR